MVFNRNLGCRGGQELHVAASQLAVESLLETLRLAIELLAGNFHADLDFQHDTIDIDAHQRGLGFRNVHAGDAAAFVKRFGNDADQFPSSRLEPAPGMMPRGNTVIRGAAICPESYQNQTCQDPAAPPMQFGRTPRKRTKTPVTPL